MNAVDYIKPNFNQLRPYEEKYFLRYIPLADQIWLIAFTFWDIGWYVNCTYFPVDDVLNFEINLSFLVKPFSCMKKKVGGRI